MNTFRIAFGKVMKRMNFHFVIFLMVCGANEVVGMDYAVLAVESPSVTGNFCIQYFPEFSGVPSHKSEAISRIPQFVTFDLCLIEPMWKNKPNIVLLSASPSNCSIASQARILQKHGAAGVLFITKENETIHFNENDPTEGVRIVVGLISENFAKRLKRIVDSTVYIFAPEGPSFDLSLLIIWFVAMFAVTVGGYWSGVVRHILYIQEKNKVPTSEGDCNTSETDEKVQTNKQNQSEESSLNVTSWQVAIFVVCMGTTLLLLYFFYGYLVYFLIGLFVLATINATYVCTYPVLMKILPHSFNLFQCHCGGKLRMIDYRHILLFAISISLPITWVVTRNERYSWILQDILGVLFCINIMRTLRLPNFKICTFLLVLLFFYDIFFVFVTPFLTAKGESVMEDVATGVKSEEKVPMVFRVPHFTLDALTVCYTHFSVLGFGDILVPGLLISYCHGFDLIAGSKHIYFLIVVISYGLGMIVTFVGLLLMETAQPALLYLAPATIIPPIVVAWKRKEFLFLWNGVKKEEAIEYDVDKNIPQSNAENIGPVGTTDANQSSFFDSGGLSVSNTTNPINNEQRLLIP